MKRMILSMICIVIILIAVSFAGVTIHSMIGSDIEGKKLLLICASLAAAAFTSDQLARVQLGKDRS
ncbi:MAG: hypothetical protein IJ130_02315 [Solobacterium sp.]|nr:hypothetical protein [Solobacterium sp.]